jgi:hypothetical protein
MPDAFDPLQPYDVVSGSDPSQADRLLGVERLRQAWPNRQLSDAQLGLAPRRQAGLANAGLPDAPWVRPQGGGGAPPFDPSKPYETVWPGTRELPDAPWATGGNQYGAIESAGEGYLKGASANWRDEIYGASEASGLPRILGGFRAPVGAGRLAYEHLTGTRGPATEEYERARDEIRARERAMQAQHPYAFGAGELGGAGASMLAMPGAGGATMAERLGNAALTGAGYGALAGAGEGEGLEDTLRSAASGAGTGAAFGTLGAGAVEALSPLATRGAARFGSVGCQHEPGRSGRSYGIHSGAL